VGLKAVERIGHRWARPIGQRAQILVEAEVLEIEIKS